MIKKNEDKVLNDMIEQMEKALKESYEARKIMINKMIEMNEERQTNLSFSLMIGKLLLNEDKILNLNVSGKKEIEEWYKMNDKIGWITKRDSLNVVYVFENVFDNFLEEICNKNNKTKKFLKNEKIIDSYDDRYVSKIRVPGGREIVKTICINLDVDLNKEDEVNE